MVSRQGCSIGAMRRWLGHSASSQMVDVYMKPVSPENREVLSDIGIDPQDVCREVLCLLGHEEQFDDWLAEQ